MNEPINNDNPQVFHVGVTLRQRIFETDVEISVSADVTQDAPLMQGLVHDLALHGLQSFIDNHAPFLPAAPEPPKPDAVWYDVTKVHCQFNTIDKYVKIFAGKWTKYGIDIANFVLADAGYMIAGFPPGDTTPNGWQVLIETDAHGKNPRILKLKTPSSKGE